MKLKYIFYFLYCGLFALLACTSDKKQFPVILPPQVPITPIVPPVVPMDTNKHYLALGDSYTIGTAVADSLRFPVQSVQFLRQRGRGFHEAEIIARAGWTTGNLIQSLNTTPPSKSIYNFVTLLIGVNNQYQGQSQQLYQTEFSELLNRAIAWAGNERSKVLVLSIPDYSVTPFAASMDTVSIAQQIQSFNNLNRTIAQTAGVHYLDITPWTRQGRVDPTLIAIDGLHPSGKAYRQWADSVATIISRNL